MTWSKDGKELKSNSHIDIVFSLGICSMEIMACEESDAGRYMCRAENEKGYEETSCKITIQSKLILYIMNKHFKRYLYNIFSCSKSEINI